MSNPQGKIVCCERCGRDTRNTGGICRECLGTHTRNPFYSHEYKGRQFRAYLVRPMDYEDDYGEESSPDDVHGGVE